MDGNSKSSAWNNVSKLELQDTSLFQSGISTNNMFSVDLKLGRFEQIGGDVPIDAMENVRSLEMTSSSSPSLALSKRGRPRSNGQQNTVSCAVDGCISDLSQCREYHRRHRVCERHSKTPVVVIGGREQRFCQQCSRFHSLGEFDDAKRSCRKRLDGHNRRRRKTQPENFYVTSSAGFQTPHTGLGSGFLQFRNPDNWTAISEPQKALYNSHQQRVPYSVSSLWSTSCIKGDKQLPFGSGMNQQTLDQQPSSSGVSLTVTRPSSLKISPDRVNESANSGCALSLLSRYRTQSSGICMGPTMQPITMSSSAQAGSTALHLDYSLAQFSCSKGMEDESSASLSSTVTENSHIFGGFQTGQDGFSENRSSLNFPFSWQ